MSQDPRLQRQALGGLGVPLRGQGPDAGELPTSPFGAEASAHAHVQTIIPFVPTNNPQLSRLVYEMILAHFLRHDPEVRSNSHRSRGTRD